MTLVSDRCIKAAGAALNVEQKSLNCLLNLKVTGPSFAETVIDREGKTGQTEIDINLF